MRYFTKELWLEGQDPTLADENDKAWASASDRYREQFESLKTRIDESALKFFDEAETHDGHLVSARVLDGRHVTYEGDIPTFNFNPVSANLVIQNPDRTIQWSLQYTNLRRALIDFPTEQPAFYSDGEGFNDIGYHELTDAGNGFLRHEFLFSSGASILFEFRNVSITSQSP